MSAASPVIMPEPAAAPIQPQRLGRWAPVFARLGVTEWSNRADGGFTDDPADHGGATKYGVSLRWLVAQGHLTPAEAKRWDIDHNGQLDARDVAGLTLAEAEQIYYDHFWLIPEVYDLPQPLDAAVFDQVVNAGEVAAFKMLQRALNVVLADVPSMARLDVDGRLGSASRGRLLACMTIRPQQLVQGYRDQAAARYRAIVCANPSQQKYLGGWLNRAAELGNV